MSAKRVMTSSRSLVALFDSGSLGTQSDRELLECFQSDSGPIGQEAFRILVERHGPMVLGLCRSLVRDQHEAEDAFQATFLVLVRKAASIERRDTLGPWLYGVAARVARRARSRLNLRRQPRSSGRADIPARDRASLRRILDRATPPRGNRTVARSIPQAAHPLLPARAELRPGRSATGCERVDAEGPSRAGEETAGDAAAGARRLSAIAGPALDRFAARCPPCPRR